MNKLIRTAKATIGVLLVLVIVSFFLPSKFGAKRALIISAPAERIYPLIEDPREWAKWSPWAEADPTMKVSFSGAPKGAGAQWAWESKTEGSGSMSFNAAEPNRKLAYTMVLENGKPANGQFLLEKTGDKTTVTWSFEGDAGYNPVARWFGFMMDKLVGPYFEKGLTKLGKVASGG